MSGKRSRTKGHNFERKVANDLRDIFPEARRGLQYRDGSECPDVTGTPFHVECKRHRRVNIRQAIKQACEDAERGMIPLAITKDDREEILVTMRYVDFLEIVKEWIDRS